MAGACLQLRGLLCKPCRATLLATGSYSLQQMLLCIWLPSQLSKKQATETHLPILHQLVYTVHISCWEENRIVWRGKKLMLCSLGCYITLTFKMLETSCFPNTSHFEIYTLATLRHLRPPLSFLTCHSLLPLHKEWILELGCLRHQMGWKLVPFPASTEALNLTVCSHILGLKKGAVLIEDHDSGALLLYHLAVLPALATLYTCSSMSNSIQKCEGNSEFHTYIIEVNWTSNFIVLSHNFSLGLKF